jgi:hypothetical protein
MITVYMVICFEVGVFLLILPWVTLWDRNFFARQYLWVLTLSQNYFVRGAVSGIGLADIFLAFAEAWRFRQRLGLTQTPPRPR